MRHVHDPRTACGREDFIAVEEPLEIRIAGDPVAVTMRTPGDDGDLALGFLYAEGIIASAADVGSIAHCGRPGDEGYGNVLEVSAAPGVALAFERVEASRRGTITTAACGVCGRRTVEDLMTACVPVADGPRIAAGVITSAVAQLSEVQRVFERTGGTHAAAAHGPDGRRAVAREDVGRHNAVDKVIGALLRDGRIGASRVHAPAPRLDPEIGGPGGAPPEQRGDGPVLLVVSGRASFEMVQKATRAGIPIVASVSAPTTLAVDLAIAANVTLAGFVRGDVVNLYAHPERIVP